MVRRLGNLTFHACDPAYCSPRMHRIEAAQLIGILIANPGLAYEIADAAKRAERTDGLQRN
jgi:hypothetical protein